MAEENQQRRQAAEDAAAELRQKHPGETVSGQAEPRGLPGSTELPIGAKQLQEASKTLAEYKQGKANLEQRIIDNEEWYKLRHWECMRRTSRKQQKKNQVEPVSGWLFNALQNKRADAMDNYPTCTVQPREASDQQEAKMLSSVIPVILDNCEFEKVYDEVMDQKLRSGTGIYGVFWDSGRLGGLGDICVKRVDPLNLFWQSGIEDIQESRNVFFVQLFDNDLLEEMYPQLRGRLGTQQAVVSQYLYDDTVNTAKKSAVVDWYYKKWQDGKMRLHYCKYCGDTVIFATENEPEYAERGWYDDGEYPFVFDPMFRTAGTPCGFGYIDVAKSEQEYIDRGSQAIMENLLANARPRHFIRTDGGVNETEYADLTNDFIHVEGSLGEDSIRPVYQSRPIAATYVNILLNKVEELKEVTGNRDVSTGGTSSGVTAGYAIAALQEAGSKLSRLGNKASHRAFRKVCLLIVERIRQFYDLPRQFRITGHMGMQEFVSYSNAGLVPRQQGQVFGQDMGIRLPLFDISIAAEKSSPYSRMSANEMAMQLYQAGFFDPRMADQALGCLELMDFDKKDRLTQIIQTNGRAWTLAQQKMQAEGTPTAARNQMPGTAGSDTQKMALGEPLPVRRARERAANGANPG